MKFDDANTRGQPPSQPLSQPLSIDGFYDPSILKEYGFSELLNIAEVCELLIADQLNKVRHIEGVKDVRPYCHHRRHTLDAGERTCNPPLL